MNLNRHCFFLIASLIAFSCNSFAQKKPKRDMSKDKSVLTVKEKETSSSTSHPPKKIVTLEPKPKKVEKSTPSIISEPVKIQPKVASYLTVNNRGTLSLSIPANGSIDKFVVSTDGDKWDVGHNTNWCDISKFDNYFIVSSQSNEMYGTRSATLYVKSDGQSVPVTITQQAKTTHVRAQIIDCPIVHEQKKIINGKKNRYIQISPLIRFKYGNGLVCRAELTFYDERNQPVYSSFPIYSAPNSTFLATSSITLSDDLERDVRVSFEIPNDALVLSKKNKLLSCVIKVYCTTAGTYIPDALYRQTFKGYYKYKKVRTKAIKQKKGKNNSETSSLSINRSLFKDDAIDNSIMEFNICGVTLKMIKVECGDFRIGSRTKSKNVDGAEPHYVSLSRDYYLGSTEVTQDLWMAVMNNAPSNKKGDRLPVEGVSWNDCMEFISRLNRITGKKFRLPTEAEWEYAALGGGKSKYYYFSGSNKLNDVGWTKQSTIRGTQIVASKIPNELGLYDMTGNVWEWCQDWKEPYPVYKEIDPIGPQSGTYKVCRGGSWRSKEESSYISFRNICAPHERHDYLGLRLCLTAE